MKYGYLDESGDIGQSANASRHLLVALVVVDQPKTLQAVIARTRRWLRQTKKDLPEFKGVSSDPRVTQRLLRELARTDCELSIVVADKSLPGPATVEALYHQLCARAIRRCAERYGPMTITLDKRHTNPRLERERLAAVVSQLAGQSVGLISRDSQAEPGLQVADVVAWGMFQRFERGVDRYYELVRARVWLEERFK